MRLLELRGWLGRMRRSEGRHPLLSTLALAGTADVAAPDVAAADHPAFDSPWTQLRLEIAESLWGEGCLLPGGTDEVLRLAVPLGVSAKSSLLLLGAGGGGPTVRLAGELGVWVTAYEADPVLAAMAARRVQRAGLALAKRATVQAWDPAAPSFRPRAFHHAIAIEALRAARPDAAVAALAQALRPSGQLAVMETVADPALNRADPALRTWCRLERRDPPPAGTAWLTGALERAGFDIRVVEDISARQIRQTMTGWKRLVRQLRADRPTPLRAAAMVAEAELWLRRVQMLRAGQLRLMRWHAIAPVQPPEAVGPSGTA